MNWKSIRLELARTSEFPGGSASRSYLLRLPIRDDGEIDEAAYRSAPTRATVRRHWPNQADMSGYIVRTKTGWAFSYLNGDDATGPMFDLESDLLRQGEFLTVTEPDGRQLPFRVAALQ